MLFMHHHEHYGFFGLAYAMRTLLPGEDPVAFERLHKELIAELAPIGAFEDETVLTLASLMCRRRNLGAFRVAKLAQDR